MFGVTFLLSGSNESQDDGSAGVASSDFVSFFSEGSADDGWLIKPKADPDGAAEAASSFGGSFTSLTDMLSNIEDACVTVFVAGSDASDLTVMLPNNELSAPPLVGGTSVPDIRSPSRSLEGGAGGAAGGGAGGRAGRAGR